MKVTVIVTMQIEGMHNFPAAKELFPEVGFLADSHRHQFHIKCSKEVTHTDRDVEFIMFKREVLQYLHEKYSIKTKIEGLYTGGFNVLFFGPMSCEQIAEDIFTQFECEWVEVWEDMENGARVEK
jgi:hypothetical protein